MIQAYCSLGSCQRIQLRRRNPLRRRTMSTSAGPFALPSGNAFVLAFRHDFACGSFKECRGDGSESNEKVLPAESQLQPKPGSLNQQLQIHPQSCCRSRPRYQQSTQCWLDQTAAASVPPNCPGARTQIDNRGLCGSGPSEELHCCLEGLE